MFCEEVRKTPEDHYDWEQKNKGGENKGNSNDSQTKNKILNNNNNNNN